MTFKAKLVSIPDVTVEGNKRQNAPYTLEWTCTCGATYEEDLFDSDSYLSSPQIGAQTKYHTQCDYCNEEHTIKIKTTLVLEIVDG